MRKTPLARRSPLKAPRRPVAKRKPPKVTTIKKLLWNECKRIVRARYGFNCYTCGKLTEAPHTGHFIPSSVCSVEMRYSLDNLRPQCFACNIHKSGNWPAYEAHLIVDHGRDYPDQLKQKNRDTTGKQYDILFYIQKLEEYKQILK
jgi:5-methylcytosine-specific restriction endonuclease McrA